MLACAWPLVATASTPQSLMQAQGAPGLELVVVDHGRIATDAAYGVRDVDTQEPVDVHTRFEIGSITKQFTAAAILQLRERRLLSLDDPLGKYVPQYPQGRAITLRELLMQVSGVPDYTETPAFGRLITVRGTTIVLSRSGSFAAILALIANKPLNFAPGARWQYSGTNYVLLGRVVEVASGMPWETYIREHIFAPAGMTESSFMEDEAGIADMATGYAHLHGQLRPTARFNGWADAAGAIVSTASDLARWDDALFGGKIVSASELRLMLTPGPLPALNAHSRYAFGWVVDRYDGEFRYWHNGGTIGFSASNQIYPGLGEDIIVLANSRDASADSIADATLEQLHPQLAAAASTAAAGEDPAITARAKAIYLQFASGNLDRSQFSASINAALTPAVVTGAQAQFEQLGTPTTWIYRGKTVSSGNTTYAYHVTFSSGVALNVYISIDAQGKVSGYVLSPT